MAEAGGGKPLVVDVDGTFLRTGLLGEALWHGLGRDPAATLRIVARHLRRPAGLSARLGRIAPPRVDLLPVNPRVAAMARAVAEEGTEVVLASASDPALVAALARHHGLSERIVASDGAGFVEGSSRAAALERKFGRGGFHYAGDARVDRAVWDVADGALLVGRARSLARPLEGDGHPVTLIAGGWSAQDLLRALRPHQYVKNLLLFAPMITAHAFDVRTALSVLAGIVAFSAAASSIYVVNDLLDLEADRLHPAKRSRPFASGAVPIRVGMGASASLAAVALGIGATLGAAFLGVVILYVVASLAYSLRLKRMRWVDVFTLAGLYTLRVVAGAAASGVDTSIFMLVFVFPVFLALGCVKRMTELARAPDDGPLPGRGYARSDRGDLLNMAGLGVAGALVIYVLYTLSPQASQLYPTRWILWLALPPIALWLLRMVALGARGMMDYDPIVFAMRDRKGIGLLLIAVGLMFWSAGLWAEWFG